jgi:hypothetical protein
VLSDDQRTPYHVHQSPRPATDTKVTSKQSKHLQGIQPLKLAQDMRLIILPIYLIHWRKRIDTPWFEVGWGEPLSVVRSVLFVHLCGRFDTKLHEVH